MRYTGERALAARPPSAPRSRAFRRASPTPLPAGNKAFAVLQAFPAAITAEEADPFLMCDHFGPTPSTGLAKHADEFPVGWHPHRGMDICTCVHEPNQLPPSRVLVNAY